MGIGNLKQFLFEFLGNAYIFFLLICGMEEKKKFIDVIKLFAPGTSLRSALDDLLRARLGALIVFKTPELANLMEGGFSIKSKFSPQKLVELAKMDGAIVLSEDGKKILYANVMLHPSLNIYSRETGTRHKSGERIAIQAKTLAVAVSERKNKISIYYCNERHELENSSIVLSRTSDFLQVLEKQKEIFDDLLRKFNLLEINNLVTIKDISSFLRRIAIAKKVADLIRRYLVELGKEGVVISMRLRELVGDIPKTEEYLLEDYFPGNSKKILHLIGELSFDSLLESSSVYEILFEEMGDMFVSSRGIRLLNKIGLDEKYLGLLLSRFDSLKKILKANDEELLGVFGSSEDVETFKNSLSDLKQNILLNKDI